MAELGSLEALQSLHRDLVAFSESRLPNIERLLIQLEQRIDDFRKLLDKPPRSQASRQKLASGKLTFDNEDYAINEVFQEGALQLADILDLDEIEAAKTFLEAQDDVETLGRSTVECAIIRFHQRRKYLLECFRLILQQGLDPNLEDDIRGVFQQAVKLVLQVEQSPANASKFVEQCFTAMSSVKSSLQGVQDKLNSVTVLGQAHNAELSETMEYQRVSLIQQHESLGVIVHYLVRSGYTKVADMQRVLGYMQAADKWDSLLAHYFPALTASIVAFGSPDGRGTWPEAKALNDTITNVPEHNAWKLHYVHAAVTIWWLSEYSGWFLEGAAPGPAAEDTSEEANRKRNEKFSRALKDGAFDFLLSLAADTKSSEWYDPARHGLRQWLQRKSPALLTESVPFSESFQLLLMEQLESFIDAFITNLPDVLRKLRLDEDEQRQLSQTHEHDLDLERFLVIISYAFEGRAEAAQGFWSDPDSNLAGFLHWASRRASTPLVSAFCEMLNSLSEDEECAEAAHEFLLDETTSSSGKLKRSHSLSWNQIFKELEFFTTKIRNRPTLPQTTGYRGGKPNAEQAETEPESAMMLECYLRLIRQLTRQSKTVREFLISHESFNIVEIIYQLAASSIPARLRACAFSTHEALLTNKSRKIADWGWAGIDSWITGAHPQPSGQPKQMPPKASQIVMDDMLREIGGGFEEPNAFVQLLTTLIAPSSEDSELRDSIPFPEELGSEVRMSGIDPYVDFVLGDVFKNKSSELEDISQLRLLRLSCLTFVATALSTFNEDLVLYANSTNIVVDKAMSAHSLESYVRLHPYSRVMEWLFNDRVMMELFNTVHQDASEVGNAAPDSPVVLCLLRGIEVMTAVMDMQSTYLDLVKPLLRLQPHRQNVSSAAFGCFEDGIVTRLDLLCDLGLYIGAGHPELATASLQLLHKLATSKKLITVSGGYGLTTRNRLIAALEANNDWLPISRSLASELQPGGDFDEGPNSSSYSTKIQILDFLNASVAASPGRPTIAHLLLGFQCLGSHLCVEPGGPFDQGTSLFHLLLNLTSDIPPGLPDTGCLSWLTTLKVKGMRLLRQLWTDSLSSSIVMPELRDNNVLFVLFVKEPVLDLGTPFDGRFLTDELFLSTSSSTSLVDFLSHRSLLLRYAAAELRQVNKDHSLSLKKRLFATLLGSTTVDGQQQIPNSTIYDFFDFMEFEFGQFPPTPDLFYFRDLDMRICTEVGDDGITTFNLQKIEEVLVLRKNEVKAQELGSIAEGVIDAEAQSVLGYVLLENSLKRLMGARLDLLDAWVQLLLVMVTVQTDERDSTNKIAFIIQTLKTILPKLEKASLNDANEALPLARLARSLVFNIDFTSSAFQQGDMGNQANSGLFELFRLCLRAIHSPISTPEVREMYYSICYHFLVGMSDISKESGLIRQHNTRTIKSAGDRLLDVMCDDAYSGDHTCRVSALLLLGALVSLAKRDNSTYIIDSLIRLNFIGILVDSIRNILPELQDTNAADIELQVSFYKAKLALLGQICEVRQGASAVLDAGYLQSVRDSALFSSDPDLRDDPNDPAATRYYELLGSIMRVINTAVFSRGPQNEQTIGLGRQFLTENRAGILAVFKKSTGVGLSKKESHDSIVELAELFMLLITMTGFLEFEDKSFDKKPKFRGFT